MPVLQRRPRRVVDDDEQSEHEQRPRQRQRRGEPESEDSEAPVSDDEQDQDQDIDGAQRDDSEQNQMVKKLVRYALACEYSRTPIRREGIKEKVLGDQGRAFKKVFEGAQKQLRAVFGMEMVELPARDKLTKEEKRKAVKSQSAGQGGQSAASNAYMLVSTLPEQYRAARIIAPSKVQSADDEAAYTGFYTLIVSIITLNSGELSHPKLKQYLRMLNTETNVHNSNKTDDVLAKLQRQGYIVKMSDKDARQNGEDDNTTWYVGPRGKKEIPPEAIAGVVRAVYGEESDELEAKLRASLRIKERVPGDDQEEEAVEQDGAANDTPVNGGSRRRSRRTAANDDYDD